ncbi:MAG: nucleotidyltransferase domain-containing protein [Candidatus Omnitrophica bacterium]|nr:nucleotidyltransferase domain-containing protein [Candidatus Omnitrophota bacterium]
MRDKVDGLDEKLVLRIVDSILKYKKPEKIMVFGSRAGEDFLKTSDVDIAIFGKDWTDKDINIVRHSLNETIKTPLKFDVLNYYHIEKTSLKNNILTAGKVIYGGREN